MIEARPSSPRGTLACSPLGFGWVLAVVVEQVTGTPFHGFVARRKVRVAGRDVGAKFEAVHNSPGFLRSLVPGAGLVCDAATLAA